MAYFPDNIVSFREKTNLPGVEFNELDEKTLFVEDIKKIEDEIVALETYFYYSLINRIFPVGSIFTTFNNYNPSNFLVGEWQLTSKGRFIVGVDPADSDYATPYVTGGEKTHTLTIAEMPSHDHEQVVGANAGSGGSGIRADYDFDGSGISAYRQQLFTLARGGTQAHENRPPYQPLYVWLRTG